MTRDNLIPTTTVDKNGKTTTVYRKIDSTSASTGTIPAPSIAGTFVSQRPPRHLMIDSIWETLMDGITRTKSPLYKDKMTDIFRNLSGAEDDAYPDMALETVRTIAPNVLHPAGIRAMILVLANHDEDKLKLLHANRDYLSSNPEDVSSLLTLSTRLAELGIEPNADGGGSTITTHLYAQKRFEETSFHLGDNASKISYRNVPKVIHLVEKYPNNVNELMEWIERTQSMEVNAAEFEEYVSQGPVREGML